MFEGQYGEILCQRSMLLDTWRTNSFKNAIFANVKKGDLVIDFGAGSGILSMFAAQAGAKKVYAIEVDTDTATVLKKNVMKNKLQHIIEIYNGDGEGFNINEKADVIVSEDMGDCLIENKMNYIFLKLVKQFLTDNGIIIPSRQTLYASPAFLNDMHEENIFFNKNVYDLDLSEMIENNSKIRTVYCCDNREVKLYDTKELFTLEKNNFDPNESVISKEIKFHANEDMLINGMLLTWDCLLGKDSNGNDIHLHNFPTRLSSLSKSHSWFQYLLLLNKIEEKVRKNQHVSFHIEIPLISKSTYDDIKYCYNIYS